MKAKEVIDSVNERLQAEGVTNPRRLLTNSKLNDFRRFLEPVPLKYPSKSIYNFSHRHCDILFSALSLIARDDRKTASAFERAILELEGIQQTRLGI